MNEKLLILDENKELYAGQVGSIWVAMGRLRSRWVKLAPVGLTLNELGLVGST